METKVIINEFIKYIFVGGAAFCLDTLTLYLCKTKVFLELGHIGLYISTALGFLAGLIFNYIFSLIFVFRGAIEENRGKNALSLFLFLIIGILGLFLTEAGMYVGVDFLNMNYLFTKVIVAIIVLVWNYTARKILIFK
ncbi:GtrA family protein [Clostridium sp. BL-8]|uniref:GtrA family protein n=1 Tax=Clostridium sp. BL-8 TaxID=349938 RepID=UPI00098C610A|nr:GtrA family protein [Clostridium sp. BL-8]OOM74854.1 GtrA-like protein [Clostridium sp. BL-8]